MIKCKVIPIYIVIGTRAQLIKMAPLLAKMQEKNIPYYFIYTAQHKETIQELLGDFKIKKPDYDFSHEITQEAKSLRLFGSWMMQMLYSLLFKRDHIIANGPGLLLTHGDTTTCVWGAILGKLTKCHVMHVESGLRSYNIFQPFPEEINRLITFLFTDIFVCPNEWAVNNVRHYDGIKINTKVNMIYDSVMFALSKQGNIALNLPHKKYSVISIHRFEHIFHKKKFWEIIQILEYVASHIHVVFVLHPSTRNQLNSYNLFARLEKNSDITLSPRLSFFKFIKLLSSSEFVITDGGSNQEELSYMGKPTLILRDVTERREGLGENAFLAKFDYRIIDEFLKSYKRYKRKAYVSSSSPSEVVTSFIEYIHKGIIYF